MSFEGEEARSSGVPAGLVARMRACASESICSMLCSSLARSSSPSTGLAAPLFPLLPPPSSLGEGVRVSGVLASSDFSSACACCDSAACGAEEWASVASTARKKSVNQWKSGNESKAAEREQRIRCETNT